MIRRSVSLLASCVLLSISTLPATAQDGSLLFNRGVPIDADPFASGDVLYPPMSYDGRYVAFHSTASRLAEQDIEVPGQVFVIDREASLIQMISTTADDEQANAPSTYPTISGDGRFVTFTSLASNLVEGDVDGTSDVFVADVQTGEITLVSHSGTGEPSGGNSYGYFPSISEDGSRIVFNSDSDNLAGQDLNGTWDVFLWERSSGVITLISTNLDGNSGNGPSMHGVISGDGRTAAFHSQSGDMAEDDNNGASDVFMVDLDSREVRLISRNTDGTIGDARSERPGIDREGNRISFSSDATNLALDDTNNAEDVFVFDRSTSEVSRVSLSPEGVEFTFARPLPMDSKSVMSPDGRHVAFRSIGSAIGMVDGDEVVSLYVRDIDDQTTELISQFPSGEQMAGNAEHHSISEDGSIVAFTLVVSPQQAQLLGNRAVPVAPLLNQDLQAPVSLGFVTDRDSNTLELLTQPE